MAEYLIEQMLPADGASVGSLTNVSFCTSSSSDYLDIDIHVPDDREMVNDATGCADGDAADESGKGGPSSKETHLINAFCITNSMHKKNI